MSKALQEELRRRREGVDDFVAPRRTYICTRPLALHEPEAAVDLFNGAILVALGIPTGGEDAGEEGEEEGEEGGEESEDGEADKGSGDGGKKASCAVCLGVGYMSDPTEPHCVEGLAHFVEHMLFMGTADYPDENSWNTFLSAHGGEDNGETDAEHTVFYFDIHPAHLREALGRFASFFRAPLFKFESAAREVKAIESEFQGAKQEDGNRQAQLLCHLTNPGHPYARFGWGDARSLEKMPAERGLPMEQARTM